MADERAIPLTVEGAKARLREAGRECDRAAGRAVGRRPWLWLGGSLLAGAVLSGVLGGRRGRRYTCRCSA